LLRASAFFVRRVAVPIFGASTNLVRQRQNRGQPPA